MKPALHRCALAGRVRDRGHLFIIGLRLGNKLLLDAYHIENILKEKSDSRFKTRRLHKRPVRIDDARFSKSRGRR